MTDDETVATGKRDEHGDGRHDDPHDDHGGGHDHGTHSGDRNGHAGHGDSHDAHEGHGGGHGHHVDVFRRRFWWNLILAIPVLVYSEMIQEWLRFTPPSFPGAGVVAPVLGSVIFVWGGWVFLAGGIAEIRNRQPGMMLLISMAITVALGASLATEAGAFDKALW